MDVHVDRMSSTLRTADSEALLEPRVLEQVVRRVLSRLREEREIEARIREERRYTASSWPEERVL